MTAKKSFRDFDFDAYDDREVLALGYISLGRIVDTEIVDPDACRKILDTFRTRDLEILVDELKWLVNATEKTIASELSAPMPRA
jgi:hypothetical protein